MIMLAVGAAIIVLTVAFFHFRHQKQFIRVESHNQLQAISELKINQLTQWYKERLSEAHFFSTNAPFNLYIEEIIQGNQHSESDFRAALLHIMSGNRYENVILLSEKGDLVYSTVNSNSEIYSSTEDLFKKVRVTRNIVVSDFYLCREHQQIHIDFISPAFDRNNQLIAFLVFRVNPQAYLFPLISNWPLPSETAETYIVRKEGDSVAFLSNLRHMQVDPLEMKLSLNANNITAVRAIKGVGGIIEGNDYRGEPVLADIRKVPDTSWYMISEIDQREIYSALYKHAVDLAIIILISFVMIGFITAWIYHYRQRNIYKELYTKQALLNFREEELRSTLYSIGEGVITTDNNGYIENLNPSADVMTGWSEDAARHNKVAEVIRIIHEDSLEPMENPVEQVLREGKMVELTDHAVLLNRENTGIPIAYNAAPIKDEKGNVLGVVLVISNQTDQRARQKALEESEEKYRRIAMNVTDVVWTADLTMRTNYVSPSVIRLLGESPEEHMKRSMDEKFPPQSLRKIEAVYAEELELEKDPAGRKDRARMLEVEHFRADGSLIWVGMNISFIRDSEGNIAGLLGVTRDISEWRQAEVALRISEEKMRTLFTVAPIGIGMVQDGVLIEVNPLICSISGYALEDLLGEPLSKLCPGHDECTLSENEKENQVLLTGKGERDVRWKKKDGTLIDVSLSWLPVDPDHASASVIFTARDISEQKSIEHKLRTSDLIFNLSLDMLSISGFDGYFKVLNPAWHKTLGWTLEELKAVPFKEFLHPDDIPGTMKTHQKLLEGMDVFQFENRYRCKDGTYKWMAWNSFCNRNEDVVFSVIRDVTERKRTEEALSNSMKNYRELIDGMNETVWVIDFKGTLLDVNRRASDILGYSKEELLQLGLTGIDSSLTREAIAGLASSMPEDELQIFETSHRTKDGKIIPVEVYSSLVTYQGQKAILSIARDIAQRKQIISDLIYAKEKAEESDRLKTAFLANVSHEIRTPMNGIMGFLELLKRPNLSEDRKEKFIEVVNQSGERLLETINKIVEVSKIESGQIDVSFTQVDIGIALRYHYDFFKEQAAGKGLALKLNVDEVSDLKIMTDRFKLDGILTNLINNAIKFTPKGYVEFGAFQEKGDLVFYVKDTGLGIPENKQDAIFERFVQADLSLTRPYEGSGLGLSIVKAYVEIIGGSVRVESKPGEGSAFYVALPLLISKETELEAAIQNLPEISINGKVKILVAEDDEISISYMKTILEGDWNELLICNNGICAVETVRNQPDISIVLMDIRMPDMSGIEATREIRKFNKTIPIIAQTANALFNDQNEALQAGCNEYLTKPLNRAKLLELILKYTRQSKDIS